MTADAPRSSYRMWFEERRDEKPLHVSPSVKSLAGWLARRDEPQRWALGLSVEHFVRYVWATREARAALGDPPTYVHPPAEPELEDFVEYVQKLGRAAARTEPLYVRMYAREAAMLAPGLLRALNDDVAVRGREEALAAALAFAVAPEHYREDLPVCLGLRSANDKGVQQAALRLARELLAFLRERAPDVDPQPDIAQYLADGTLERHLGSWAMPEPEWSLRPASNADRDFAFELNRVTMKEYVEVTWGWDDAEQEALFDESFDPADCEIIRVGSTDVGLLAVEEHDHDIYLAGIYVQPEWQSRGIGSSIVRSLLEHGAASGKAVTLRVLHSNPRAEALYAGLGFTRFRVTETHAYLRADPSARD